MVISNAFDSFLFPDKRTKDLAYLKFWHQRFFYGPKWYPRFLAGLVTREERKVTILLLF